MGRVLNYIDQKILSKTISILDLLGSKVGIFNLRAKLMLGSSAIIVLIMGLFNYYQITVQKSHAVSEYHQLASDYGQIILAGLEHPMKDGAAKLIQSTLEKMHQLKAIETVAISDLSGTIQYSGLPQEIGRSITSKITQKAILSGSMVANFETNNIYFCAIPIRNEKSCYACHQPGEKILGVLSVGMDWSPKNNNLKAFRNRQIILLVTSLLFISFFLALFISRFVTRPLSKLTRISDKVSRGRWLDDIDFNLNKSAQCWKKLNCDKSLCPAYDNYTAMCWQIEGTQCYKHPSGKAQEKADITVCQKCEVYTTQVSDEMVHLMYSFKHMLTRISIFEQELKKSKEKYKILFDSGPDSSFILDPKTLQIIDANRTAEKFYGYTKDEFLKLTFTDLGSPEDTQEIIANFKHDSNLNVLFPKKQHRRTDNEVFYVNIHMCTIDYMEMPALIATTTDITDSVQKELQLIQTSKMATLGEMAAGVAHEINQPLSAIRFGSDFLIEQIELAAKIADEDLKNVAQEINRQVERIAGIITHMRDFSRIANIETKKININEPLTNVYHLLQEQLRLCAINIDLSIDKNMPQIMADKNRLEQVLINLVINAKHAMENKPENTIKNLKICSFFDEKEVIIKISDTGHGIPSKVVDKIFDPFFTTKEVGKGTGLGLSISYGIIKDYGGIINVESEMGQGTTFDIRFPVITEITQLNNN